ncbi:hypothetical protein L7F22_024012 [Adiantum nelumboides]|nr:hypothetical protein [Adiantum nelumboides]
MAGRRRHHHALAVPFPGQGHANPLMRLCTRLAAHHAFTITFVDIHHQIAAEPSPASDEKFSPVPTTHAVDPSPAADEEPSPVPISHHKPSPAADDEEPSPAPIAHDDPSPAAADDGEPSPAPIAHDQSSPAPLQKLDIRRVRLPLLLPPPSSTSVSMMETFFVSAQNLAPQIEQLLLLQDPPISCVISDLFMTGATQVVADKLHLPRLALIPCSQSMLLHFHHILQGGLSLEEVMKVSSQRELLSEDVFKEGLQGLPTLKVGDLMENLGEDLFMYSFVCQALQETKRHAHGLVANSFEEIEGSALKVNMGAPVYVVGPLVESLDKEVGASLLAAEDDACLLWLDQQPCSSVLFIAFGSFVSISSTQFEELVAGLLSSQRRFLWVMRPNLIKDASCSTFPEQLLSKSHGKGFVVSWAPQVKVLSHPSIQGFFTHCGWNSSLEAISRGVPMICFPCLGDQFMNAKLIVEEWKVGVHLRKSKKSGLVEREEVESAIRALMEDEQGKPLHENALRVKQACHQSHLPGGYAFLNVQALAQSLT